MPALRTLHNKHAYQCQLYVPYTTNTHTNASSTYLTQLTRIPMPALRTWWRYVSQAPLTQLTRIPMPALRTWWRYVSQAPLTQLTRVPMPALLTWWRYVSTNTLQGAENSDGSSVQTFSNASFISS